MTQSDLPISEERICLAYSLSKYTIKDELNEFEKYNSMTIGEFYEFIARIAEFLYQNEYAALFGRIEQLLINLLPLCGEQYTSLTGNQEIDSESDYEDDIINELNK